MVLAVRCPNAQCRKFMMVEDSDRGQTVPCLVCKQPIRVPAAAPADGPAAHPGKPPRA